MHSCIAATLCDLNNGTTEYLPYHHTRNKVHRQAAHITASGCGLNICARKNEHIRYEKQQHNLKEQAISRLTQIAARQYGCFRQEKQWRTRIWRATELHHLMIFVS
ncbi:hypothetical protein NDU88_000721 [Pleurodeles waltl]|uniref:Uncharacterized protein n=1 Tax=Pleurodeles waltl TaxID=8319 RepID=A0AAV7VY48_PLEWA|nr:hypothetical protein NDU88_000721 [Pleurodeles waltl]